MPTLSLLHDCEQILDRNNIRRDPSWLKVPGSQSAMAAWLCALGQVVVVGGACRERVLTSQWTNRREGGKLIPLGRSHLLKFPQLLQTALPDGTKHSAPKSVTASCIPTTPPRVCL